MDSGPFTGSPFAHPNAEKIGMPKARYILHS